MKLARLVRAVLQHVDGGLSRAHVWMMRDSFAAFGAGSRVARRVRLMAPELISVGQGVNIGEQAWLNAKDDRGNGQPTLRIGDGTYIGRYTQINAWRDVVIGRKVLIADRAFISDADHVFAGNAPIMDQGDAFIAPVHLHDGCWIGIGAVILPGVTVGRNAVVAANAVVTENVPEGTVVGGVPARIIKQARDKV